MVVKISELNLFAQKKLRKKVVFTPLAASSQAFDYAATITDHPEVHVSIHLIKRSIKRGAGYKPIVVLVLSRKYPSTRSGEPHQLLSQELGKNEIFHSDDSPSKPTPLEESHADAVAFTLLMRTIAHNARLKLNSHQQGTEIEKHGNELLAALKSAFPKVNP